MRAVYDLEAPKRAVNLSLNSDLVAQCRGVTDNLSEVVERLLAEYVAGERAKSDAQAIAAREAIASWNAFAEQHGSFADKHSTL